MRLNDALPRDHRRSRDATRCAPTACCCTCDAGDARCRSRSATRCSEMRRLARPPARRLGLSRRAASRTRAGSRPRCRRARSPARATLERFLDDALWQAGHATLPFVAAAHDAPERLVELDLAHDAALAQPRRQPREPQPGRARISTRARGASAAPDCAACARRARRRRRGTSRRCSARRSRRSTSTATRRFACTCTASRAGCVSAAVRLGLRRPERGAGDCRRGPRRRSTRCSRAARISTWLAQTQTAPLHDLLGRRPRAALLAPLHILTDGVPVSHDHSHGHDRTVTRTTPWDGPGRFAERARRLRATSRDAPFTVGIGGPVGSGKTALLLALCRRAARSTCGSAS